MSPATPLTRREVAVAGHVGDVDTARRGLVSDDPAVRATALGALDRAGQLDDGTLRDGLNDGDPVVRRRAVELASTRPDVGLETALDDDDPGVLEAAAWACGEREAMGSVLVPRLVDLAAAHDDDLVREAAVAALGAIGDDRAVEVIVAATSDKPAVRRRAVLALAPFVGDDRAEVDAAIHRALDDRNWQVRQAAEDITDRTGHEVGRHDERDDG